MMDDRVVCCFGLLPMDEPAAVCDFEAFAEVGFFFMLVDGLLLCGIEIEPCILVAD